MPTHYLVTTISITSNLVSSHYLVWCCVGTHVRVKEFGQTLKRALSHEFKSPTDLIREVEKSDCGLIGG